MPGKPQPIRYLKAQTTPPTREGSSASSLPFPTPHFSPSYEVKSFEALKTLPSSPLPVVYRDR